MVFVLLFIVLHLGFFGALLAYTLASASAFVGIAIFTAVRFHRNTRASVRPVDRLAAVELLSLNARPLGGDQPRVSHAVRGHADSRCLLAPDDHVGEYSSQTILARLVLVVNSALLFIYLRCRPDSSGRTTFNRSDGPSPHRHGGSWASRSPCFSSLSSFPTSLSRRSLGCQVRHRTGRPQHPRHRIVSLGGRRSCHFLPKRSRRDTRSSVELPRLHADQCDPEPRPDPAGTGSWAPLSRGPSPGSCIPRWGPSCCRANGPSARGNGAWCSPPCWPL